jgi:putative phosphoribosyl transferase
LTSKVVEHPELRDRTGVYRDRVEAGQYLAGELKEYDGDPDVVVLAVPAGGVPVGCEIARSLKVPLDVVVTRKVQIPWSPEAGFGAVAWDGRCILNEKLVEQLQLTQSEQEKAVFEAKRNVEERLKKFRGDKPLPHLVGKRVILVDDGLASGYTMLVSAKSVKANAPKMVIVAVPTASFGAVELLQPEVDVVVCPNIRTDDLFAVAEAYLNWYDLTDKEVLELLC